ncbi:Global transcription regulator sge1 [Polyrhizophydium stewartii]|uniref:Global transcription regulator sge1 n=1 Tax=Polyrhizophydium stewartii TaxID=2732419 RepID=A0ABR4N634_9FUNG
MQPETFNGLVETTHDALVLFGAVRRGVLHCVPARLSDAHKAAIASGSCFVFCERDSGIRRWTDGRLWGPSRILGHFFVYRELDFKLPAPRHEKYVRSSRKVVQLNGKQALVSSKGTYIVRDGGLIKKTISVTMDGQTYHLVAYYTQLDLVSRRLETPRQVPELACLRPDESAIRLSLAYGGKRRRTEPRADEPNDSHDNNDESDAHDSRDHPEAQDDDNDKVSAAGCHGPSRANGEAPSSQVPVARRRTRSADSADSGIIVRHAGLGSLLRDGSYASSVLLGSSKLLVPSSRSKAPRPRHRTAGGCSTSSLDSGPVSSPGSAAAASAIAASAIATSVATVSTMPGPPAATAPAAALSSLALGGFGMHMGPAADVLAGGLISTGMASLAFAASSAAPPPAATAPFPPPAASPPDHGGSNSAAGDDAAVITPESLLGSDPFQADPFQSDPLTASPGLMGAPTTYSMFAAAAAVAAAAATSQNGQQAHSQPPGVHGYQLSQAQISHAQQSSHTQPLSHTYHQQQHQQQHHQQHQQQPSSASLSMHIPMLLDLDLNAHSLMPAIPPLQMPSALQHPQQQMQAPASMPATASMPHPAPLQAPAAIPVLTPPPTSTAAWPTPPPPWTVPGQPQPLSHQRQQHLHQELQATTPLQHLQLHHQQQHPMPEPQRSLYCAPPSAPPEMQAPECGDSDLLDALFNGTGEDMAEVVHERRVMCGAGGIAVASALTGVHEA